MADIYELESEAEKLRDEGKYEEAIAKLDELLSADDKFVRAHLALAVIYGRLHQHEKAIEHGERACEIEPTDSFNFTALSVVYQRALTATQNPQYKNLAEQAMDRSRMLMS